MHPDGGCHAGLYGVGIRVILPLLILLFAQNNTITFRVPLFHLPQHRLYFFPLLHGHGALRPVPGYFSLCVRSAAPRDASRGKFGNISRCRLIIGTTSDSQKSANSAAFILSVSRIWARLSSRSVSGSNARFQHSRAIESAFCICSCDPSVSSSNGCAYATIDSAIIPTIHLPSCRAEQFK